MSMVRHVLVVAGVGVALALGCAGGESGKNLPPPEGFDLGPNDWSVSVDNGALNDAQVTDTKGGADIVGLPDSNLSDTKMILRGEIMPAGALSTGGAFALVSTVGPGLGATVQTDGSVTLRWFMLGIPW